MSLFLIILSYRYLIICKFSPCGLWSFPPKLIKKSINLFCMKKKPSGLNHLVRHISVL